VVFLVIVLLPSGLLVLSGWRLMRHDAEEERRARRDRLAGEIVTALQQRVQEIDRARPRHASTTTRTR
jgi:hypothetical protein